MVDSDMAERLSLARKKAGFESARAAAQAFGWKESTYAAHENGQNGIKPDIASRYSRAFRVSPAWLLTGEGAAESSVNEIPVMGYIGAGAEIMPEFEQVPYDGLYQVELPFMIPDELVAFEVQGPSMLPRYDEGDVIICYRESRRPIEALLGEEVAVRTEDGRRFLKRILRGHKSRTYNLESFNARTMESVKIDWVGEIWMTVRTGQIRRIEQRERGALARQRATASRA